MSDLLLDRLARENPVAEIDALPFAEIATRIQAGGVVEAAPAGGDAHRAVGRLGRRSTAGVHRPVARRGWFASLAAAATAVVVAVFALAHNRSAMPASGVQRPAGTVASRRVEAHFAVLRSASAAALPSGLAPRINGRLRGSVAEVRRIVSPEATIWIALGADGRLCVTMTVAGHRETLKISCGGEAQALRVGVRVAGRLGPSARYVVGVVPDAVSHVTVHAGHGRRVLLTAHHNVYATVFGAGRRSRSPAE